MIGPKVADNKAMTSKTGEYCWRQLVEKADTSVRCIHLGDISRGCFALRLLNVLKMYKETNKLQNNQHKYKRNHDLHTRTTNKTAHLKKQRMDTRPI